MVGYINTNKDYLHGPKNETHRYCLSTRDPHRKDFREMSYSGFFFLLKSVDAARFRG